MYACDVCPLFNAIVDFLFAAPSVRFVVLRLLGATPFCIRGLSQSPVTQKCLGNRPDHFPLRFVVPPVLELRDVA